MRSYSIARARSACAGTVATVLACAVLLLAGNAHAEETVEAFVARYEVALDRGDPELLRAVYEDWSIEKENRLREYFGETVREFNVEFSELEVVAAEPERAEIRFVRRDRFTDTISGARIEKRLTLDRTLHRFGGLWKLAPTSDSRSQ